MSEVENMTSNEILRGWEEKVLSAASAQWAMELNVAEECGPQNRLKLIIKGCQYHDENAYVHLDLENFFLHAQRLGDWSRQQLNDCADSCERIAQTFRKKAVIADDYEAKYSEFHYDHGELVYDPYEGKVVPAPKDQTRPS